MKRGILLYGFILVFIFSLMGCSKNTTTTIRRLYDYKTSDITRIEFVDMNIRTQKQPLAVEDKKKIGEFLGYLDDCTLKKADEKEAKTGWTYQALLYNKDKEIVSITFGSPILLKNYEDKIQRFNFQSYATVKNEITPKQMEDFLASVNADWIPTP